MIFTEGLDRTAKEAVDVRPLRFAKFSDTRRTATSRTTAVRFEQSLCYNALCDVGLGTLVHRLDAAAKALGRLPISHRDANSYWYLDKGSVAAATDTAIAGHRR